MAVILGYGLGTLILTAALAWGILSYQRRNKANAPITEKATQELYQHPERYEAQSHDDLQSKLRS